MDSGMSPPDARVDAHQGECCDSERAHGFLQALFPAVSLLMVRSSLSSEGLFDLFNRKIFQVGSVV
jgi:hypothetical protein